MKKKVLCVIPARSGSKGICGKNLQKLNGKPLIYYVIKTAQECSLIDRMIVSTDSEEIATVVNLFGAETPFIRPPEIAQDATPLFPVLIHAMKYFDCQDWRADIIISFQPTSPLTRREDLESGIGKILETDCDSVSSVCKISQYHPFRALKLAGDRVYPLTEYTNENFANRQDRPPAYGHNGAFYIRKRQLLDNWDGKDFAFGEDARALVMDRQHSINIDTLLELKLAEIVMRGELQFSNLSPQGNR